MLSALTLWQREIIRFYRQRSRVIGAIGSPLVFWLLIGSGIGTSFKSGDVTYLQYFFPGSLLLIVLFTSIFSTISLIEDRKEGFLQSVLVAPVSRFSIVLGKVLGGTTLAFLQGLVFLLLAPFAGIEWGIDNLVFICLLLLLNAFCLSALGFLMAWKFNSVQGFHAVMNLFLFPLWILSGALFPAEGASVWLKTVMQWNPLSYSLAALRWAMFGSEVELTKSIGITVGFGTLLFIASCRMAARRSEKDLA